MKLCVLLLLILLKTSCFAYTQEEVQNFLKNYYASNEKVYWSETVYAVEKDYSDDIVLFCLHKFGLTTPLYPSENIKPVTLESMYRQQNGDWIKQIDWSKRTDRLPVFVKNILVTSVRKKRLDVLKELLLYFPSQDIQFISEFQISWNKNGPAIGYSPDNPINSKVTSESNAITIAIREIEEPLEYVQLFLQFSKHTIIIANAIDTPAGATPLMEAFIRDKMDVVKLLLSSGANAAADSLLACSIKQDRLDYIEVFLKNSRSYLDIAEGLYVAIQQKNKNAIIFLLNYGASPTWKLRDKTLLETAFDIGDSEIIDILLMYI